MEYEEIQMMEDKEVTKEQLKYFVMNNDLEKLSDYFGIELIFTLRNGNQFLTINNIFENVTQEIPLRMENLNFISNFYKIKKI